jgi:nucleotide-binding universal stress UspA family protein
MPKRTTKRILRAATLLLSKRDQLEMRAVDTLLAAFERKRKPRRAGASRRARHQEGAMIRRSEWGGFRSILCAVDFSEPSRRALRYAVAVARRGKAALQVLYVNDPLLVASASTALHDRQLVKRSARELKAFINTTVPTEARARLRVRSGASIGNAADQILKHAHRSGTDLIVLGTHGLTGGTRLFMGSTTLAVLQRTAVPVLAVPPSAPARIQSWPGGRIVAAIELDARSGSEIRRAAQVARWFDSSLLLLHVVGETPAPAWLRNGRNAHDRTQIMARMHRRLGDLARRSTAHVVTDVQVVHGQVADEVGAFAAVQRAGLLVCALRDRRHWFGARRGSITYHVLSRGATPVLAYPPHWRPR